MRQLPRLLLATAALGGGIPIAPPSRPRGRELSESYQQRMDAAKAKRARKNALRAARLA